MSQFYDDNNELNIYYPVNSSMTYKLEEDFENIQVIMPLVSNQIHNLENLFHIYEFKIFSPYIDTFIIDELEFINDNYLMLHNIDDILDDNVQSKIVFQYLYELIVNDLLTQIIPNILSKHDDLKINDLLLIDIDTLKKYIFEILKIKNDNFNKIKNNISNINVSNFYYKSLKYTWLMDLFDSDLELFKNNLLDPLLIKYQDEIEAFVF